MKRWFIALRVNEKPFQVPAKLKNAVAHHDLAHFVIGMRYEKTHCFRKPEHYIFLHVESETVGDISYFRQDLDRMLSSLHLYNEEIYLTADEIENAQWISQTLELHSFRQLRRRQHLRLPPSDPLSYEEHQTQTQAEQTTSQNDNYDHLLQWLSAYGQGTWQQFKSTCNILGLDPSYEYSRRILRRLRLLGHIEVTSDGQRWFIAPPSLVATESADGRYRIFLSGQRSPVLLHELRDTAQVEIEMQPYGDAPKVVRATFNNQDQATCFARDFSQLHHSLFMPGRAGIEIGCALPHLADWERQLPSPDIDNADYEFELWRDGEFYQLPLPSETGMYRLSPLADRLKYLQRTLYYNAQQKLWRRADWYGLRYLTLRHIGENILFRYNHDLKTLSIDQGRRLPHMYERALVLAAGRLPLIHNTEVIFGDVPAELGRILASKLEAAFVEHRRN